MESPREEPCPGTARFIRDRQGEKQESDRSGVDQVGEAIVLSIVDEENVDAEIAQGHYREALALAETLGMRPLVAHCHLGLGRLYGRKKKRQEADEHVARAVAMYRDMGMRFWHEQTIAVG